MSLIQGEFFGQNVEIVTIAVCWASISVEDVIRANFGLLNVQESDHARDECELDRGDDEEDCEGDVETFLLKHCVFLFLYRNFEF